MNQTHLHLLINHLPIFGSILGGFVLFYGLWVKSNETKIAAYYLFIISTLGAIIAYLTGEAAEEAVENIPGISKDLIEQHEDLAVIALVALIILGVSALIGLFLAIKKSSFTRMTAILIFIISIISFGIIGRTGYIGGQIRHTEINATTTNSTQEGNQEHED